VKLGFRSNLWSYLDFESDLDESKTRRVEFQIFRYAIYFNFQDQKKPYHWNVIGSIASNGRINYPTTERVKRCLDNLLKALAEGENNESAE
jgi:hypothetical protein